jgi:hypothetical protein
MPNSLLTISMITSELLDSFQNNLVFTRDVMRQYSSEYARPGDKIGPTLSIRLPAQLRTTSGANLSVQDYVEQSVPLTIDQQEHVDVQFSSFEMTLSLDAWRQRIGTPSGIVLANTVDKYGLAQYWKVPNAVLSPVSAPTASKFYAYLQAHALLADNGTPADGEWYAVLNQWEQAGVVNENKGLFESGPEIRRQYERGEMGMAGGFTWKWSQNVATHTTGPRGGTPTYTSTGAGGTSIVTGGWTTAAANRVKKGDIFTIAAVNAVNPVSRQDTGQLRQFTALADAASDASGNATIQISPAIIGPAGNDPHQTVTVLPTASAPLTFLGTANTVYYQNIVHEKQAFAMAMCRLQEPYSGQASYATDPDTGVAIRTWKASDISTDMHASRGDIAFGWAVTRPQWAVRVWSAPIVLS